MPAQAPEEQKQHVQTFLEHRERLGLIQRSTNRTNPTTEEKRDDCDALFDLKDDSDSDSQEEGKEDKTEFM